MTRRHVVSVFKASVLTGAAAVSLTGCTLAYDPDNPVFGTGTKVTADPIELVASDGTELASLTQAFTDATDIPVQAVEEASGDYDLVEWDSSEVGSTEIGRQFWCVVADQAWFEVNQLAMPSSLSDLRKAQWAPELALEDPASSEAVLLWLTRIEKPADYLGRLVDRGAQLGGSSDSAHLRVDSALAPWRTVNNLQTSSRWVTLPQTCVEDQVAVSATGEDAQAFVDFLLSPEGQTAMVEAGAAYPLDSSAPLPESVEAVSPSPAAGDVEVPPGDLSREAEVLRAWIEASAE